MSVKNPMTAGIESATFRFVAQHLNHCATAGVELVIYLKLDIIHRHADLDSEVGVK